MANWAWSAYVIEGPKETLQKIYDAIQSTQNNDEGYKWEPDVLDTLGIVYDGMKNEYGDLISLRGNIMPDTVVFNNGILRFSAEEAWGISDLKTVLKASFQGLTIYYCVEESNEGIYATNDKEGHYFKERFFVDACIDNEYASEYFTTEKEAFEWISKFTGRKIKSEEDIDELNDDYEDPVDFDENYVYFHVYDIVDD